jgi:dual specificity protein kinase YAK1
MNAPDSFPEHFFECNDSVFLPQFGRVTVERHMGAGTFGQVYKVVSPPYCFALKVIPRRNSYAIRQAENEIRKYDFIQREFNDSARSAVGRMIHYCAGDQNFVFILLDFYEESLLDVLCRLQHGLPLRVIHMALAKLSAVISEMSRLGMRHTDIKPENIMLCDPDEFRLIDFGGACLAEESLGSYVQTRWYRAPEVALGASPGCAADIW